jgi:hypothetical protein
MDTVPVAPQGSKHVPASNPLLKAALEYAGRGWRVFPIHTPTSEGCSCQKPDCNRSRGKHPRNSNGVTGASSDASKIRGWWARWPDANIGVATGPESGIFVLDVDGAKGQASLGALEPLPATLRANTGRTGAHAERTGFHLYFTSPTGVNLRTNVGLLGKELDIRGAGGYVVAPPSLHTSGLRYEWASCESAIVDAPEWFIERASGTVGGSAPTLETGFIYEGERNDRLFRFAAKWRRQGATEDDLAMRLRGLNLRKCKPPLEDSQVQRIARSAAACICVGSLDPLDTAWEKARAENHYYAYEKLLALIRHLAPSSDCTILLPVERIGKLIGCDRTLIGRHRKRAIADGFIQEVEKYIPQQKATRFKLLKLPPEYPTNRCSTKNVP